MNIWFLFFLEKNSQCCKITCHLYVMDERRSLVCLLRYEYFFLMVPFWSYEYFVFCKAFDASNFKPCNSELPLRIQFFHAATCYVPAKLMGNLLSNLLQNFSVGASRPRHEPPRYMHSVGLNTAASHTLKKQTRSKNSTVLAKRRLTRMD